METETQPTTDNDRLAKIETDLELIMRGVSTIATSKKAADVLEARVKQLETELAGRANLPIVTAIHRALTAARRSDAATADLDPIVMELEAALAAAGVTEYWPAVGDTFDPDRHNALAATDSPAPAVVEVHASGVEHANGVLIGAAVTTG